MFTDNPVYGNLACTFDTPGVYDYHCSPHQDMVGTITVVRQWCGGEDVPSICRSVRRQWGGQELPRCAVSVRPNWEAQLTHQAPKSTVFAQYL